MVVVASGAVYIIIMATVEQVTGRRIGFILWLIGLILSAALGAVIETNL